PPLTNSRRPAGAPGREGADPSAAGWPRRTCPPTVALTGPSGGVSPAAAAWPGAAAVDAVVAATAAVVIRRAVRALLARVGLVMSDSVVGDLWCPDAAGPEVP